MIEAIWYPKADHSIIIPVKIQKRNLLRLHAFSELLTIQLAFAGSRKHGTKRVIKVDIKVKEEKDALLTTSKVAQNVDEPVISGMICILNLSKKTLNPKTGWY